MIRVLKSRLLEYGQVSVFHGIFTSSEISNPVVLFCSKGKETLGMRLLAMGINKMREHVKIRFIIYGHYRLDGSNNLNVQDYDNFVLEGKRTAYYVFSNCVC